MIFIVTQEKRNVTLEASIISKKGVARVYRIENSRELKEFENGILVNSIEGVFEIAEEIKNRSRI